MSHRSILQPDLLEERNTEAELEAHIQRAIQRELFLLRRADRIDAYQNGLGNGKANVNGADGVVDDGDDDDGIVQTDVEDDPVAAAATEDEKFFGSICTDPLSPQGRQSPFEYPRLTESTTSSAPTECQSLVARQIGGDIDEDHDSALSWEKWIAHYFTCGGESRGAF